MAPIATKRLQEPAEEQLQGLSRRNLLAPGSDSPQTWKPVLTFEFDLVRLFVWIWFVWVLGFGFRVRVWGWGLGFGVRV